MIRHNGITFQDNSITHRGLATHFASGRGIYMQHWPAGTSMLYEMMKHVMLKDGYATKQCLFDHLYGGDTNGGPNDGINIFDVHLCRTAERMANIGLKVTRERWNTMMHYKLVPIDVV